MNGAYWRRYRRTYNGVAAILRHADAAAILSAGEVGLLLGMNVGDTITFLSMATWERLNDNVEASVRSYQQTLGNVISVVTEHELSKLLSGEDRYQAAAILNMRIGDSITFPASGARWERVADDTLPNLQFAIVCGQRAPKRCQYCTSPHTKLCDFPVQRNGEAGTCDAPLCDACAIRVRQGIDYCKTHKAISERRA